MEFRRHHPQRIAAAKAGFSERTAPPDRARSPLPPQKPPIPGRGAVRSRIRFDGLWESESCRCSRARPGLRPITLLEEMQRRHPDHDWDRLRRTSGAPGP